MGRETLPVYIDEIMADLNRQLEHNIEMISIYEVIIPIIKEYEGKKISQRISNKIKEVLNPIGYTVYYEHEKGQKYEIIIWKDYNKRHFIGLGREDYLFEGIIKEIYNTLERFKQYKAKIEIAISKKIVIALLAGEWNKHIEEMKKIREKVENNMGVGIHHSFYI